MMQHINISSHGRLYSGELDHAGLQVAPSERLDGDVHQHRFRAQFGDMESNPCYGGLQYYLPNDPALQVVPNEHSGSRTAPEVSFSDSDKWFVDGGDSPDTSRQGASLSTIEKFKQNKLQNWLKIAAGLLGIIAVIVVIVVVTIIEIRRSHKSHTPTATSTPNGSQGLQPANATNQSLMAYDPMVGTSLALSLFGNSATRQSSVLLPGLSIFYQSIDGPVMFSQLEGSSEETWSPARPLLTDAVNNTGLASYSYLNGSTLQASIFYIGYEGQVQEQRNYSNSFLWSAASTIDTIHYVPASPASPPGSDGDLPILGGSYRLAAAFSSGFRDGPEGRIYYHNQAANGTYYVQEVIWKQSSNSYTLGSIFMDAIPGSHLAVSINEATQTLHLFYSTKNLTLQEVYLNISDSGAPYQKGVSFPSLLASDSADFAAISAGNSTFLYYFSALDRSFHEINITATYESFPTDPVQALSLWYSSSSFPVVAQPALTTTGNQTALYQPVSAAVLDIAGSEPVISIFWTEGNLAPDSGYTALKGVSRSLGEEWNPSSQVPASVRLSV